MKMQVERWGKRLALELPEEFIERYRLREGDEIDVAAIEAALEARRQEVEEQRELALRELAARRFPLPPDYKFDREEANAR